MPLGPRGPLNSKTAASYSYDACAVTAPPDPPAGANHRRGDGLAGRQHLAPRASPIVPLPPFVSRVPVRARPPTVVHGHGRCVWHGPASRRTSGQPQCRARSTDGVGIGRRRRGSMLPTPCPHTVSSCLLCSALVWPPSATRAAEPHSKTRPGADRCSLSCSLSM